MERTVKSSELQCVLWIKPLFVILRQFESESFSKGLGGNRIFREGNWNSKKLDITVRDV